MKWYSVKEFTPPFGVECIVFTVDNHVHLARQVDTEDLTEWIIDYHCEECDNGSFSELHTVTHFAQIEAVPRGIYQLT